MSKLGQKIMLQEAGVVKTFDVTVLGAGPAGLAAGLSAKHEGASTLIIEREKKPGGILKQCIHDGFGLVEFGEKLSGPEYAGRYIKEVLNAEIPIWTSTFVTRIKKADGFFEITLVNREGVLYIASRSIVLACGCRERTPKQVFIHGTRPAGVYTAGTAQYLVNVLGYLPCKRCVILGSGDIGLIMARRLTLEGANVIGVYEAKKEPSGLSRNIAQCLNDFNIPLHVSKTVSRIFGDERIEAVEISSVDENMNPIPGTGEILECDGLILSVGLIPENELAESMNIPIDRNTRGPYVDQDMMTQVKGVFSCGNSLHVNDLVDYVSKSGRIAGKSAAMYCKSAYEVKRVAAKAQGDISYIVPQFINIKSRNKNPVIYFRVRNTLKNSTVAVTAGGKVIFKKKYPSLRPPEMQRVEISLDGLTEIEDGIDLILEG